MFYRIQVLFPITGEIWLSKVFTTYVRAFKYMNVRFLPMADKISNVYHYNIREIKGGKK